MCVEVIVCYMIVVFFETQCRIYVADTNYWYCWASANLEK